MTNRSLLIVVAGQLGAMLATGGGPACASCGDWLAHNEALNQSVMAVAVSTDPMETTVFDERGSLPAAPCSGLHCRQAPSNPMTPASPGITIAISDLAVLVSPAAWTAVTRPASAVADVSARSTKGFPFRIDHPPRS